jgi:hypothetical protein
MAAILPGRTNFAGYLGLKLTGSIVTLFWLNEILLGFKYYS